MGVGKILNMAHPLASLPTSLSTETSSGCGSRLIATTKLSAATRLSALVGEEKLLIVATGGGKIVYTNNAFTPAKLEVGPLKPLGL